MPLLARPSPELLDAYNRGCTVGHWLHFGEFMQEVWDLSNQLKATSILSSDNPREVKSIGFSLFHESADPYKTWRFSLREIAILVEAIPNDRDRAEVASHISTSKGRATIAAHLSYTRPRPELRG